jgi:glycosyltransferase involved in cell wall biosynthesis
MKIAIITDTWDAVNGVVTTFRHVIEELKIRGHEILIIEPSMFKTISAPRYKEIKLAYDLWKIKKYLNEFNPDAIHIVTEGPIGLAARFYCRFGKIPHNSSYHTKFPEYLEVYYYIPKRLGYYILKLFHKFSSRVLVPSKTIKQELEEYNFKNNILIWSRGVDKSIFKPKQRIKNERKILLSVSRVSIEKNLDAFCSIQTDARKILVGDGPYLDTLKKKYSDVEFVGYKFGEELAAYYLMADVFVFTSKTDTYGVVMLEAIACGTPIAAFPVTGPIDIITEKSGVMDEDINKAIEKCYALSRDDVFLCSEHFSWKNTADIFEKALVKIN